VSNTLCEDIIRLDTNIRFAGIVNKKGEVVEGGYKEGVEPLLNGPDEQEMYELSLSNMTLLRDFSDRLGKVKYNITEHQKIVLMTFPLEDGILCLSVNSSANIDKIKRSILDIISTKPYKSIRGDNIAKKQKSKKG
jgi:hypothetical protein